MGRAFLVAARRGVIAGLAATTAIMVQAIATAAQTNPDGVRRGDRWSYDITDDVSGELKRSITMTVIEIGESEINVRAVSRGQERHRTFIYTPYWARIDDDAWKFSPHDGMEFKPPLQAGREWRIDHTAKNL